jgi:Lrp/AsnC family transcriptional regulator for asnA, asnC and gidA
MGDKEVTIDSIDAKLISLLLKNARTKTKDLAKACGMSSTAVGNRIKKLKKTGVITGSALVVKMSEFGYMYPASISIERSGAEDAEKLVSLIQHFSNVFFSGASFGKCDLQIFLVSKSLKEIDNLKQLISKHLLGRISVDLWNTPWVSFDNIDINGR